MLERILDRAYKIDIDGKLNFVSASRLKPAYFILKVIVNTLLPDAGESQVD